MSDKKDNKFNIDAEVTGINDIPSVTRLLNRSDFNLKAAAVPAAATAQPPPSPEPSEIDDSGGIDLGESPTEFQVESSGPPNSGAGSIKIRPAVSRGSPRPTPLTEWNAEDLKHGTDPMGVGLAALIETGILKSAVFLGIESSPPSQKFQATAALASKEKFALWIGMKWDPKTAPDLWNTFLKAGTIELTPPGSVTNAMSSRNLVRGAFGVDQKEWITLVRIGTAQNCRGMLALISNGSLQIKLAQVMHLFGATPKSS